MGMKVSNDLSETAKRICLPIFERTPRDRVSIYCIFNFSFNNFLCFVRHTKAKELSLSLTGLRLFFSEAGESGQPGPVSLRLANVH